MKTTDITNDTLRASLKSKEFNTVRVLEYKVGSRWIEKDLELDTYTDEMKDRFLSKDTLRWFKNLGGLETVKQGAFKGFGATINVSVSPDRTERKTTYFLF